MKPGNCTAEQVLRNLVNSLLDPGFSGKQGKGEKLAFFVALADAEKYLEEYDSKIGRRAAPFFRSNN